MRLGDDRAGKWAGMRYGARGLFLALALCGAVRANAAPNILPNPGFEVVKDGWAESWARSVPPGTGTIDLDDQVKHSGKYSAHFKYNAAAGPKATPNLFVQNDPSPRFRPGVTYTYSAWVKTKELNGNAFLYLYELPHPIAPNQMHESKDLRGTNDWTRLTITFTARKDITTIQARFQTDGVPGQFKGEAWVDDCKVEEGATPTDYEDAWQDEFYLIGPKPAGFAVDFDYQPSAEYATPCAAPSKSPDAPGTPILFAVQWNLVRPVIELAERTNIAPTTVVLNGGQLHEECAKRLRAELARNPKALVMSNQSWEWLVGEDRAAIEKRVSEGMSMVFPDAYSPGKRFSELLAHCGTPKPGSGPGLRLYPLGRGVIAVTDWAPIGETTYTREQYYDRTVRAICAAAGLPTGKLSLQAAPAQPQTGQPWKVRAELQESANDVAPAQIRLRIRPDVKGDGDTLPILAIPVLQDTQASLATGTGIVEMASQPIGDYFIEAAALDKEQRVLAWTLQPVSVSGQVLVSSMTADDPVLRPGKDTAVKVALENRTNAAQAVTLRASLVDTEERVLARFPPAAVNLAPGRAEQTIKVSASDSATPLARLVLELEANGTVLQRSRLNLSAEPLLREPDFRLAIYSDFMPGCRELGADTAISTSGTSIGLRLFPWLAAVPWGEDYGPLKAGDVITDPALIKKCSGMVSDALRSIKPFHALGVMLVDEWSNRLRPSPHNLVCFKEFLRKTYGDVASLNRSWGTQLQSFDEVTLDACSTLAIRDRGASPVPWADLQTAMEHAAMDFMLALRQAALDADPEARVGLSGTQEPTATNGLDWWLLMKVFRSMGDYGGVNDDLIESFAAPGSVLYNWSYPTDNAVGRARHDPWRDLFRGRDGYLHYGAGYTPLFMPDDRPFPVAGVIAGEVEAIRRGPARLVRGAQRDRFGIAILYSMPSYHASYIPVLRAAGRDYMNDILYSTESALADAWLDSRLVSREQLAKGEVTAKEYKALFLPYAQALSAAEVAAIREFAGAGGVVIADVRPGIYDEHCKKLAAGALDDLFGIGPAGAGPVLSAATLKPGPEYGPSTDAAVLMGESDLAPAGATVCAQMTAKEKNAPALLIHRAGKGRAVLLNFAFPDYHKFRAGGVGGEVGIEHTAKEAAAVRGVLARLLEKEAQIAPPARLLAADGAELRGVRMYTYRDGNAAYLGLIPSYTWVEGEKPVLDAKLVLRRPGELYDVRAGEYLGNSGTASIKVQETYAKLYAVLPYRVQALALTAPATVKAGDSIAVQCRVQTDGAKPGRHVFVARLVRPDGAERRWDRLTWEGKQGAGDATIPLALNDPAGNWKLVVQDAATGVGAEAVVRVQAGQ